MDAAAGSPDGEFRVMKSAALFGTLIALCSIGGLITSASAKSGGVGAAAAAGVHVGLRAGGPAFFHTIGPVVARGLAARRAFGGMNLRRRQISTLPYSPSYGDFDPFYYYPATDAALAQGTTSTAAGDPIAPSQVPPNRVLVVRPGCRTQDQKVQSEEGGERLIHITRCY
jgi:hypothetical protein